MTWQIPTTTPSKCFQAPHDINKSILSFEKFDLRNLVAKISNFQIEYVPGESNVFRDWLSRK